MSQSDFSYTDNTELCYTCLDTYPPDFMHEAACSHKYCKDCFQCMFISFYERKEFASRCCNTIIASVSYMASKISESFYLELVARQAEKNRPDRTMHSNTNAVAPISNYHICNKCLKGGNKAKPSLDDGLQEPVKKQGRKSYCKCLTFLGEGYVSDSDDDNITCYCRPYPCHKCGESVDYCYSGYYAGPEALIANVSGGETVYMTPMYRGGKEEEDVLAEEATD